MTIVHDVSVAAPAPAEATGSVFLAWPVIAFVALSTLFGSLAILLNPPLYGPDEGAHFLRAYAISAGDLLSSQSDARGRRGVFLSADLFDDFRSYEAAREHRARPVSDRPRDAAPTDARVFVPYGGSEGYSPVPYVAYAAAAGLSRLAGLDFLPMLYAMRLAGLLAATALVAYAIALTPHLKWAFAAIALLPTAIYERAVVSADGAALALALMVTALALRGGAGESGRRAVWMVLCALAKPPQLAFVLLEATHGRGAAVRRLALVVLLPAALSFGWVVLVSADAGAWRVSDGLPADEFDPLWKLSFLFAHPLRVLGMAVVSLDYSFELWRQLIGYFGWLDTPLQPGFYPLLTLVPAATFFERLERADRHRVAAVAAVTATSYCVAVFLIFFLVFTPTEADRIHGLQGRYFLPVLPLVALTVAALVDRAPPPVTAAAIALASALLSGVATIEALWRAPG
jgi:uncharacterized membrane protein